MEGGVPLFESLQILIFPRKITLGYFLEIERFGREFLFHRTVNRFTALASLQRPRDRANKRNSKDIIYFSILRCEKLFE